MSESEKKCSGCGQVITEGFQCRTCLTKTKSETLSLESGETLEALLARAEVKVPLSGAVLINKETSDSYSLNQSVSKIGRDKSNNISLHNDSYISRHHAWVLFIKGNYFVEDLGSTNGTFLNGEVLSERKQIFPGDRIKFGRTELIFEIN